MKNNNTNLSLPPKKGTVDQLITIPADIEKVLAGKKTATRRNGRYADVGEIMSLEGEKFQIDSVYQQSLGELTNSDAIREGYEDLNAYKQAILSIHPEMPWLPKMKVWVHEFSAVK